MVKMPKVETESACENADAMFVFLTLNNSIKSSAVSEMLTPYDLNRPLRLSPILFTPHNDNQL